MSDKIVIIGASLAGPMPRKPCVRKGSAAGSCLPVRNRMCPISARRYQRASCKAGRNWTQSCFEGDWYRQNDIDLRIGARAIRVGPAEHMVWFESGHTVLFDKLLLATGSSPRHLDIPGAQLDGVRYLRTLDDSIQLRNDFASSSRVAIIGAGWIGATARDNPGAAGVNLETAAAARAAGLDVTVIETPHFRCCASWAPRPLALAAGRDGWVSIEVDARYAHNAEATIAEATALHWLVDRDNLFIKVPATDEGMPAVTALTADGISVNITLIFSVARYQNVMAAWLAGLDLARQRGHDLSRIHAVASFFISRVDAAADAQLAEDNSPAASELKNTLGIANAQLAWTAYRRILDSDRWSSLAAAGANPQRPLSASTGVKDPALPADFYVTGLAGPGVVNTNARSHAARCCRQCPGHSREHARRFRERSLRNTAALPLRRYRHRCDSRPARN